MNTKNEKHVLDFEERAIMLERARDLANPAVKKKDQELLYRVSVVQVGAERFGLPQEHLCELLLCPTITPLPGLPPWISGVAKTRESVVTVVDMAQWLGLKNNSNSPRYLAVIRGAPGRLALAIDDGGGFRDVYKNEVAEELTYETQSNKLPILATTRDLITIIDCNALLNASAMRVRAD